MISPHPAAAPFAGRLVEQIRIVGLGLRREAIAFALILLLLSLAGALDSAKSAAGLTAHPELLLATLPLAVLLPLGVWRGEPVFGEAYSWLRPVSRQQAALMRVLAGLFWLILAILVVLAWTMAIAALSGGTIGISEQRYVGDPQASLEQVARIRWSTPAWMWAVPFVAAIILYALASAAVIGLKHPLRIIGGALFAFAMLVAFVLVAIPNGMIEDALARFQYEVLGGPYGLVQALTASASGVSAAVRGPAGAATLVWSELPSIAHWAPAMLLWLTVAMVALALAIGRHREPARP